MRNASPRVVLLLLALAGTASAQAPSTDAAAVAPVAGAATVVRTPAPAAAAPSPLPNVAAPALAVPAVSRRKFQLGLSFLPMALGKFTYAETDTRSVSAETYFAYAFGVSAGNEVLPGLLVGFAPQVIFNVQPKPSDTAKPTAAIEYDFLARVAYQLRLVDAISVYGEALPGFSLIVPSGNVSHGLVVAVGVGCVADLTDRYFFNVGAGYQMGFQNQTVGVHTLVLSTNYLRVAVGGGVRF